MDAAEVIRRLGLSPLGFEGGYYRETFRQSGEVDTYGAPRAPSTAIFYLLTPDTCSLMHRLRGPEVYHFYLGDPVEQLMVGAAGPEVVHLGQDLLAGQRVQHLVPGGVWQGSRLLPGGRFALMGTTMAPGFDLADFTLGRRDQLLPLCAGHEALLTALTPTRVTTEHLELAAATLDLLHAERRGPAFLAAGLGAEPPVAWPPPGRTQDDLQRELTALEQDRGRRGWGSYYVLAPGGRLVGVIDLAGRPDPAGPVNLTCMMLPEGELWAEEARAGLTAHAQATPALTSPPGPERAPRPRRPVVGVMGGGDASPEVAALAYALGRAVADAGWVLLNGGRDAGVMAASARGAHEAGGLVVGVLPGADDTGASPHLDVVVRTGLGDARNAVNVLSSDVVVALPGGAGTVSEVALAVKAGRPVVLLGWSLHRLFTPTQVTDVGSVAEVVATVQARLPNSG